MTIEAMKRALEALEAAPTSWRAPEAQAALRTAIEAAEKQQALDKKAENARELGLDYEPAAPVQEPRCAVIVEVFGKDWRLDYMSLPVGKHKLYTQQYIYTTPPAAPVQESVAWRETHGKVIKALAGIVTVHTPDNLFDLDAIPREPVIRLVQQIKVAIDKYTTPPAAPVQEPVAQEGWKVVPVEPTDRMLTALTNVGIPHCARPGGVTAIDAYGLDNVWRAMMELTPDPPAAQRTWVGLTDEEIKPLCDENHIIYGAYTVDFIQAIEAKLKEKNT